MDTKELKLINKRFEDQMKNMTNFEKAVRELFKAYKTDNDNAHLLITNAMNELSETISNPHVGLWAETKANTSFRKNITKVLWIVLPIMLFSIGWLFKNSTLVTG